MIDDRILLRKCAFNSRRYSISDRVKRAAKLYFVIKESTFSRQNLIKETIKSDHGQNVFDACHQLYRILYS